MRRSAFNDHMATCNTAGACVATNDSPFSFEGHVLVRLLHVGTGKAAVISRENVSLPAGPKVTTRLSPLRLLACRLALELPCADAALACQVSHWFCAGGAAGVAQQRAPPAYAVHHGCPSDRSNFTKTLTGAKVSTATCEAACTVAPACLGFTQYDSDTHKYGRDCWLYDAVPSLAPARGVSFHQK